MSQESLRLAGPDDDTRIRALIAAAYPDNPKADAAITRWQYWDNPFGRTRSWVWERDGQAVGHWAAVPVPLVLDGVAATGAKGVDIATHPDARRRGLFARLAARLLEDLADAQVPALLSHPNPSSAPAVQRAGAALVERVPAFVRALDAAWLAERFRLPGPAARLAVRAAFPTRRAGPAREVDRPPEDLDALWGRLDERWGIRRDAAWWRWRYVERPGGAYRFVEVRRNGAPVGAAALRVREAFGGRFGYVMEFLAVDEEAATALTGALGELARAERAAGLVLIGTSWSRPVALARRAGFRGLPRRLEPNPLRFLVAEPGGDSARLARRGWSAAWGDLDHL